MSQPLSPGEPAIEVAPLTEIPFARVDLATLENPVPQIFEAPEFAETQRYFAESPSVHRSLLTSTAQALLYTVIRNQQPEHVVEIGTYNGGTAETMGRALHGNGHGTLHTVSPFDAERFGNNYRWWPDALKARVRYHAMNSMDFFILAETRKLALDLVLVDGNHDYEFACFDIQSAARRLTRGGFIFIDNVAQAGPFLAAAEFYAANPDWIDCGVRLLGTACERAFDRDRANVPVTDFFVFRAPAYFTAGAKPQSFGDIDWSGAPVRGLRLSLADGQGVGTLRAQCILRAFSDARIEELIGEIAEQIHGDSAEVEIEFASPIAADGEFLFYRVETWLIWTGPSPLRLAKLPSPF
jgi:predicted O-methyltransferase YrrM